jgi:hypothetical protein
MARELRDPLSSRKFLLVLFDISIITGFALCTARWPGLQALFAGYVATVVTLSGLYFGANLGAAAIAPKGTPANPPP